MLKDILGNDRVFNVTIDLGAYESLYKAMAITSVTKDYAPVTGGTQVIIKGSGFLAVANQSLVTISLCGIPATITSVSNTEIICTTGVSTKSQLEDIVIYNGSESRRFIDHFTYYPVEFVKNGNWNEPYNWKTQTDDRILPYPDDHVYIKANCLQDINIAIDTITVYPGIFYTLKDSVLNAKVFTLKDNASFLNNGGTMSAIQQNLEHTLAKERNWYVSTPIKTAQTINMAFGTGAAGRNLIGDFSSNDWRIEQYDESVPDWDRLQPGGTLTNGMGYTAYSTFEDIAVKFSGTYNDSDVPSPLLTRYYNGFNLVGNPFPSYWRWTEATALSANVYSTIWYRTFIAGEYEFLSFNASGNVAVAPGWDDGTPSGSYSLSYIPPMQAFWVRLKDGAAPGTTINFANNRRSHADHPSNILKSGKLNADNTDTRKRIRIALSGDKNTDEVLIYTNDMAQNGFDDYDSDKWFTGAEVELFTMPVGQKRELVINGLPEISEGMEIPLGFQANKGGSFKFFAKELKNLDSLQVYLRDKLRNLEFNLSTDSVYNFTAGSDLNTGRFSIVYRSSPTGNEGNTNDSNLSAYSDKNGDIVVTYNGNENTDVTVYNLSGSVLTVQKVSSGNQTVIKGNFAQGVYIVRAGNYTTKVTVNR